MIITCEKCSTKFNLDENLLKQTGSKVRCSKCQNIFLAYPPIEMERVAESAEGVVGSETVSSDVEAESLELPEPEAEKEPKELLGLELETEPVAEETPEEPELEFELEDIDKEETKKEVAETVDLGAQADQLKAEEVEKPLEADVKTEEASTITEQKTAPAEKKRISTPVLIVLIIALLTGGAYGTYVVLKSMNIKIPFISDLTKPVVQDVGNLKINTFDIADKFIDNSMIGKLFIISGKVKNEYSEARSFIRVTGKLYAKGKILSKSATVCCGNMLSDQDLSNMDMNSINKKLANRLGDNKSNVNVKPGKLLPFMIVFPNIPDNIFRIVPQYPVVEKFMTVFPNIPGNIEVYTVEVAGSSPA